MRMLLGLFACSLFFMASYTGCTSENNGTGTSVATGAGVGGSPITGLNPTCNGKNADQYCNGLGANPEDCSCVDCAYAAMCTSKCVDNGVCDFAAGEDCTCADCYGKQGVDKPQEEQCPPYSV